MAPGDDSHSRIHAAFLNGDLESLRIEIGHLGGFPNVAPHVAIGIPLVYAIYHSPLAFVEELLEAGADPNQTDGDGFPPLIAALTCGTSMPGATTGRKMEELVELLLTCGADVGQRGINDYAPLHMAAEHGDLAMVELLLRFGADPNEITRIDDNDTPLELADRAGHEDVADRLRPLTIRLDWEQAAADGDVVILRHMRRNGHNIDATNGQGLTALMQAAHGGHREAVDWLIGEGANLDHTSKYHLSALMLAVVGKHDKAARDLVRAGADVTIEGSGAPGFAGQTAADLAEAAGLRRLGSYIRNSDR